MGGSGSLSKRKSSKRKSSDISSKARRKQKTRRNKKKKLSRCDDSVSSYSDDDSLSSGSDSSSDSGEVYKRKKSKTRSRSHVKSRKRQARRSLSREKSDDSLRLKKRKGSSKMAYSKMSRKSKKKRRRYTSSDTESCSTCRSKSSSSSRSQGSKPDRPRGRSKERNKDKRVTPDARIGSRTRSRSPSCSSCSKYSAPSSSFGYKHEILENENNSRRLRSIVTVVEKHHEIPENPREMDLQKEEIVYDTGDYPSPRSNDSNDREGKRDLSYTSNLESDKNEQVNMTEQETSFSEPRFERVDSGREVMDGHDARLSVSKENESKLPDAVASSISDDLELTLRQKALENLRRFRESYSGTTKTSNQDIKNDASISESSAAKVEIIKCKPLILSHEARSSHPVEKITKEANIHTPDGPVISACSNKDDPSTAQANIDKSESGKLALKHELSGSPFTLKATLTSVSSPREKSLPLKGSVDETAPEISQSMASTSIDEGRVSNGGHSATKEVISGIFNDESVPKDSPEQKDEAKDGSQFQQKTMSVMRGGEMVQVSYKVYIPKRAPALSRRQLQR